ncbi:KxYKxGKxW signal peptide domain-containing protein [Streptococcus dentapri]|uniref:KxYKxGKxW signal peptide domain-containing protein n=1 Tax=Streptococcus dentapri TaxID=573564 RepID=A0ABV8D382_9STRE
MEKQTHFKQHKVKKHWVTIAGTVTLLAASVLAGAVVNADETVVSDQAQANTEQVVEQPVATETTPAQDTITETEQTSALVAEPQDQKALQAPVNGQQAPQETPKVASDDQRQTEEAKQATEQNDKATEKQDLQVDNQVTEQHSQVNENPEAQANDQVVEQASPEQAVDLKIQAPNNSQAAHSFNEKNGRWYFLDANKQKVTGWQTINGQKLYFHNNGEQAKGRAIEIDGATYYFDQDTGNMWTNRFAQITNYDHYNSKYPDWYYFGADGKMLTGWQTIEGRKMYFITANDAKDTPYFKRFEGAQVKGRLQTIDGKDYYFDQDNGGICPNTDVTINGITYQLDENGVAKKIIEHPEDTQKGGHFELKDFYQGEYSAHYKSWVYIGQDGLPVTGQQTINGKKLFFFGGGEQAIDRFAWHNGNTYYFDENGEMVTNQTVEITRGNSSMYSGYQPEYNGWIHISSDGTADDGYKNINGSKYVYKKDANGKWDWVKKEAS